MRDFINIKGKDSSIELYDRGELLVYHNLLEPRGPFSYFIAIKKIFRTHKKKPQS